MSGIVNLNKARKARAKASGKARAAENRVRFGRSKAETSEAEAEVRRLERRLDEARRGED